MSYHRLWVGVVLIVLTVQGAAYAQRATAPGAKPSYPAEQPRAVSTLSAEDISQLMAGGGWGLAKPAEFNGYPGPAHVIELADKLALTSQQRTQVDLIFKRMQMRAKSTGSRFVAAEIAIDQVFKSGYAAMDSLQVKLRDSERLRAELRRAHLQAHIETAAVLSVEQRRKYSELRGYGVATSLQDHQHKH